MAMGTRKQREKQEDIWIAHTELPSAPGHPFYQRLNELLEAEKFDEFVEGRCAKFYAAKYGRPSLSPGIYFRSLLLGYFEGIDSERGIAWQLADSPDHTTISRTRRLIDVETHRDVFGWVLGVLADRGLVKGKRIAIDATTLEANAAMRSIVRRDTGESYEEFLGGLGKAAGIETPSREDLARLDRKRKKRMSNKDWESPVDGDARITKMKDGRTHLAHKAEHAADLDTGAVVAMAEQGYAQGQRRGNRRDGSGQGLPQRRGLGAGEELPSAYLHSRKETSGAAPLGGQERGATGCVPESATGARRLRQEFAAAARRTGGTQLRALLRDGPHEAQTSTRTREYSEAATGPCGDVQLEPDLAQS